MTSSRFTKTLKAAMRKGKSPPAARHLLNTSSTLLNLACSGKSKGGIETGGYYFLVGDSSAGKSWLANALLAEACIDPYFDNYRLIYNDPEHGAHMDRARFFGEKMAERVEPPNGDRDNPEHSVTLEDFYYHMDDLAEANQPFIEILDSMDALYSNEDKKKFKERKAHARRKAKKEVETEESEGTAKKEKGTYGLGKAKVNSGDMRIIHNHIVKSNSILVILAQTRDRIGFLAQYDPKTRSGGKSLTFYAQLEIWLSIAAHIKTEVYGKPVEQGIISRMRVRKNRIVGRDRTVDVPILHSSGIDDLGGMIGFLAYWGHFQLLNKKGTKISAPDFDWRGSTEGLIQKILEEKREKELRAVVVSVWNDVEDKATPIRKSRYS